MAVRARMEPMRPSEEIIPVVEPEGSTSMRAQQEPMRPSEDCSVMELESSLQRGSEEPTGANDLER